MTVKFWTALFAAVLLVQASNCDSDYSEDRRIISQYFNYVDIIARIKFDNMLDMTRIFVTQLLDSVPHDVRGNTAVMLQEYIDNAERMSQMSASLDEKEAVLQELQQLIGTIQSEMVKQEREDLIIRRGLMGMFELLARLSIEERKFHEKFAYATEVLRSKLRPEELQRNARLLNAARSVEEEQDIGRREEFMRIFKDVKRLEYGA